MAPKPTIYLDTNAFNPKEYPKFRTQLSKLLGLARNLDVDVRVPAPVFAELRAHNLRIFEERRTAALDRQNDMRKMCHQGEVESYNDLPSLEEFERGFESWKSLLLEKFGITECPFPDLSLGEAFDAATLKVLPFEDSGKGFQDFVIVKSVLQDTEKSGIEQAVLVANDGAILDTSWPEPHSALTLEQSVDLLDSMLDEEQRKENKRLEGLALSCIMGATDEILDAASRVTDFSTHLGISPSQVRQISELQNPKIEVIDLPGLGDGDEATSFIADVVVRGTIFVTSETYFSQQEEPLGPGYEAPVAQPQSAGFGLLGFTLTPPKIDVRPYKVDVTVQVMLEQNRDEFTFNGMGHTHTKSVELDWALMYFKWQADRDQTQTPESESE